MTPAFSDGFARRAEFPILATHAYLANCSQGPQSVRTRAAADAFLDGWRDRGMDWPGWIDEVNAARAAFARLIGAPPATIAVASSVSDAVSALAGALDYRPERNRVLVGTAEFPTVAHAWQAQHRRGAEVVWTDPADVERHLGADTVVASIAHGSYRDGALTDPARIAATAHRHGAHVFVDAYQTAGVVPIDAVRWGVDFLAAGCLKYLLGTAGIAFLYVREDLIPRLEPLTTGWFGRQQPFAFDPATLDWAASASRFDTGTPPLINAAIARAGIALIADVGVGPIRDRILTLSAHASERARTAGLAVVSPPPERRSATTAIDVGERAADLEARLRAERIIVSARGNVVRVAPHFFTTEAEVDAAIDALAAGLRR
ncbi:MAG: aminotransferase class V-fold PLP-dependent enzyme [Gemmatimonadales bacterium]